MAKEIKLGPTGKFPLGKHNENDIGALNIGISIDNGKLIIDFGVSTKWVGFDKSTAQNFIDILQNRINEL